MASGHVYRANQAEHMAAPTTLQVKILLANPEPSRHGPRPPRCGAAQVGSCLGDTGRGANPSGKAARDPLRTRGNFFTASLISFRPSQLLLCGIGLRQSGRREAWRPTACGTEVPHSAADLKQALIFCFPVRAAMTRYLAR